MYYVYVVGNECGSSVKIGHTKNIEQRLSQLQTGYPDQLTVFFTKTTETLNEARQLEDAAHNRLRRYRQTGEWFDVSASVAQKAIEDAAVHEGLDPEECARRIGVVKEKLLKLEEAGREITHIMAVMKTELDRQHASYMANIREWSQLRDELILLEA